MTTPPQAPTTGVTEGPSASGSGSEPEVETAECGKVEKVAEMGGGHLVGDQEPPVPYNSTPPTSGWHASGEVAFEVLPEGRPLSEPEQVTVLELGGVMVTYNGVSGADRKTLERLVGQKYDGLAALSSYDKLPEGSVAMTAWAVVQRCDGVNTAAIDDFIATYPEDAPEH